MKKKLAVGLTGAMLAGALVVSQAAVSVFAEDNKTTLSV